jgi:hypothetical protein
MWTQETPCSGCAWLGAACCSALLRCRLRRRYRKPQRHIPDAATATLAISTGLKVLTVWMRSAGSKSPVLDSFILGAAGNSCEVPCSGKEGRAGTKALISSSMAVVLPGSSPLVPDDPEVLGLVLPPGGRASAICNSLTLTRPCTGSLSPASRILPVCCPVCMRKVPLQDCCNFESLPACPSCCWLDPMRRRRCLLLVLGRLDPALIPAKPKR